MSELAWFGVALLIVVVIGVPLWVMRSKTTIDPVPEPEKSLAQQVYEGRLAQRSAEFDSRLKMMKPVSYPAYEYDPNVDIPVEERVAQTVPRVATKRPKVHRKASAKKVAAKKVAVKIAAKKRAKRKR